MTPDPLRFVLLFHDHPFPHYDLMFEFGTVLQTWRLSKNLTNQVFTAEKLQDHRLAYLDYEGPVSNDRGSVKRIDKGIYLTSAVTDDLVMIDLEGDNFKGTLTLDRMGTDNWMGYFNGIT